MVDQLLYFVDEFIKRKVSVDSYNEWIIERGMEFASLGEDGREPFHRVSATSSKYNSKIVDKKFTQLINSHNGKRNIESFFHHCIHDLGIPPTKLLNHYNRSTKTKKINLYIKENTIEKEKYLYNLDDILNAEKEETIWGYLTKGVNNAFVASSEAGKTTLLLNLALAIIKGQETFLSWDINALKRRVLYVATEDGISQMRRKFEALAKDEKVEDPDSFLCIFESHNILVRLREVLSISPCDLIIFDTWGDLVGGKYDAEYTRKTMYEIRKVCTEFDGTPVYVHHTNKASENIPEKASIKGAGDFEQACRVVMFLTIYKESRWFCCVKGNPFPEDYKSTCYELSFDYEHQRVSRGPGEMSRFEIARLLKTETMGRQERKIDWKSILDEPMKHKKLMIEVSNITGLGEESAKKRIAKAFGNEIISKDKNGLYCL